MFCSKEWVKDLLTKVLKKKLNNYSLEEQKVGTWIDGKPLYQKTFKFESVSGINNFAIDISNPDTIFIAEGYAINGSNNIRPLIFPYFNSLDEVNTAFITSAKNEIAFRLGVNVTLLTAIVTIRYTKTTD